MDFQNYIINFDNYNKTIVYDFKLNNGGIGDLIKFFIFTLELCIKYKIKLYILENNYILRIKKYLKLKYDKMYLIENINFKQITIEELKNLNNLNNIFIYKITPYDLYEIFNFDEIKLKIDDIFEFTNEIIINKQKLLLENINNNYISIHLRLGDKFLETDKNYVSCKEDTRLYSEENLFSCIENNYNKNIIFFCDNNKYKLYLKEKYQKVIITNCNIGHTSFTNTTDEQILDTITEFYIMTNSEKIYIASVSGFSIIASKFKNIPLIKI